MNTKYSFSLPLFPSLLFWKISTHYCMSRIRQASRCKTNAGAGWERCSGRPPSMCQYLSGVRRTFMWWDNLDQEFRSQVGWQRNPPEGTTQSRYQSQSSRVKEESIDCESPAQEVRARRMKRVLTDGVNWAQWQSPGWGRRVSTGQAPWQEVSEPGQSEEGIPNGVIHYGLVRVSEPRPVRKIRRWQSGMGCVVHRGK